MDTGDILAVSYTSYHGNLVKIFTGSIWTHIGMVIRKDDGIYVIEIARYGRNNRGLILKPLHDWISWNKNNMMALRKYDGELPFPKEELEEHLKQYKDVEEDFSVISWLKSTIHRKYHPPDKDYFYCSEFISHTLQSLNVMKKRIISSSFKPWELLYGKLALNSGYSYQCPVLLKM